MLQVRRGLDLRRKRSAPIDGGEFGPQHLDRDLAVVLEVLREVDRGHAAGTELALERVAVGECGLQPVRDAQETNPARE